jgi:lipoprotein signal peptidase
LWFTTGLVLLVFVNEVLAGFFGVMVRNYGVSFGFNIGGILLNIAVFLILGYKVIWRGEGGGLAAVFWGGGLNLVDRIRFGYVRDYWELFFGLYNNLADWMIVLGAGVFIINLWMKRSE